MKRIVDLVVGLFALVVLFVPIVMVAILVKLTSKGSMLYWSNRVGHKNKLFRMPKFRTMQMDTPEMATHLMNTPDAYLSPIGRFLRRSSLDELPQIFNILKGNMSFIGPRPYLEREIKDYKNFFSLYKTVKPGLSGLWQVSGRNNTTFDERVSLDEFYIENKTFLMDLKIFLKTFLVVLLRRGAY